MGVEIASSGNQPCPTSTSVIVVASFPFIKNVSPDTSLPISELFVEATTLPSKVRTLMAFMRLLSNRLYFLIYPYFSAICYCIYPLYKSFFIKIQKSRAARISLKFHTFREFPGGYFPFFENKIQRFFEIVI